MEVTIYPDSSGNLNSKELSVDRLDFKVEESEVDEKSKYSFVIPINDGKGEIFLYLTRKQVAFLANSMQYFLDE
ncbi:hypothetical protein [Emticicia sp. BO119]|uniref:hypothetical protein n=1 Tax=Emticicia sp. BO119 TaxID=2757768 RepID=UPI0015F010A2|nr:hypothetical protein [Emticicia sp. BO119]MBA4852069.1 hypothetical protein [Emticicia sp. BO119]